MKRTQIMYLVFVIAFATCAEARTDLADVLISQTAIADKVLSQKFDGTSSVQLTLTHAGPELARASILISATGADQTNLIELGLCESNEMIANLIICGVEGQQITLSLSEHQTGNTSVVEMRIRLRATNEKLNINPHLRRLLGTQFTGQLN